MASRDELLDSLQSFADAYNENAQLRAMNKDWVRTLAVRAADLDLVMTLRLEGTLQALAEAPAAFDLEMVGDSELLSAIFYGELSPTEPFMDGRLTVHGSEDDLVRLDFITAMLWE